MTYDVPISVDLHLLKSIVLQQNNHKTHIICLEILNNEHLLVRKLRLADSNMKKHMQVWARNTLRCINLGQTYIAMHSFIISHYVIDPGTLFHLFHHM